MIRSTGSAGLAGELYLFLSQKSQVGFRWRKVDGLLIILGSRCGSACPAVQIRGGGWEQEIPRERAAFLQLRQDLQARVRTFGHAHSYSSVRLNNRSGRESAKFAIEPGNSSEVRTRCIAGPQMSRRDRGLKFIGASGDVSTSTTAPRGIQRSLTLSDAEAIPESSILFLKTQRVAVVIYSGQIPGTVEQHECQQCLRFRFHGLTHQQLHQ